MKGVNKVILIGTLGADPEIRYMPNNDAVANFTIATNESWKDKQTGQVQQRTEWHRIVIFGKLAEIAGEYLRKGSPVYIEGKLQTRKWTDQATGQDKYTTEIVVDFSGVMQMLGKASSGVPPIGSKDKPQQQPGGYQEAPAEVQANAKQRQAQPEPPADFDDDIPFMRYAFERHAHLVV